jgi:ATP:ADP antiporter, AAA family
MLKKVFYIFAPINKGEWAKFICMGSLFCCVLFNYNILRALKDGLIVPNIGAEAISFVKMYAITPAAISFMILYTYLSNILSFHRMFFYISGFFLLFFISFALFFYPYRDLIHPSPELIESLIHSKITILSFSIDMEHFKWFFKLYGKWIFVMFYVIAELWGSAMIFLLYWQFANKTTKTEEAKRLYPTYAFVGHIGSTVSGMVTEYLAMTEIGNIVFFGREYNGFISYSMMITSTSTVLAIAFFCYLHYRLVPKPIAHISTEQKPAILKSKLTLKESFKIVFSSRYLGLIVILVFCYGISINLIEGVWKDKVRHVYSSTREYAYFMGNVAKWTGIVTLICTLMGGVILRNLGWFAGAMATPLIMLITGISFFTFVIFGKYFSNYLLQINVSAVYVAVFLGALQNILSKGTKYSLFDATKEMAYIPANDHIKSKGKAAVDVVGARLAKSGGALLQSLLFIIFPFTTFDALAPYFMVIVLMLLVLWLWGVIKLDKSYSALSQKPHE